MLAHRSVVLALTRYPGGECIERLRTLAAVERLRVIQVRLDDRALPRALCLQHRLLCIRQQRQRADPDTAELARVVVLGGAAQTHERLTEPLEVHPLAIV